MRDSEVNAMLDKVNLGQRLFDLVRPFAPELPNTLDEARAAGLRDTGLTSLAAVRLMLEIEAAFDLVIPDAELTPENFESIDAIARLVGRLRVG